MQFFRQKCINIAGILEEKGLECLKVQTSVMKVLFGREHKSSKKKKGTLQAKMLKTFIQMAIS